MEIEVLRNKVIEECERCFAPRSLIDEHRNLPNRVRDSELCKYVVDTVNANITNILYKKFNERINSISNDKKPDSEVKGLLGKELPNNEKIKAFITSTLNGYASTRFRNLFKNGLITPEEEKKRTVFATDKFDARTIRKFINRETIPDEKTLDLFSIFLQFAGWNTFKNWIREQQRLNGDNPIIPIINIPQSKPSTVKRLEIPGATIIDEVFIEETKKQEFSMIEFYTAIKDSQWLGIVNNCYVERRGYEQLKNAVLESLNQKREYKVCGIVHGTGGSGKSTVLRRLCIDIQHVANHIVIWINDVMEFCQHGISTIKQDLETNNENKYLIVIEDWYRMFHKDSETGSKILKQLHEYNNIRIVIGDRTIVGKSYDEYGSDYNLLLSSNENKEIIEQIIKKYPNWEDSAKQLLEDDRYNQSTLFLLLFLLARLNEDSSINLSDPSVVFQNIIKSDIKHIKEKYLGLAKSLYYYGHLYSKYRVYITYETFLEIADYFNGDQKISRIFSRWNINDPSMEKLKIYNTTKEVAVFDKNRNFIIFNHDIFCDLGIRNIHFKGWEEFGDTVILQLIDIIIAGDNYCASQFLESILSQEPQIFKNDAEKLEFIEKVLCEEGRSYQYKLKVYRANLILQSENWRNLDSILIEDLLSRADNETVLSFSNNYFEGSDWKIDFMRHQRTCWYNADVVVKREFANRILRDNDNLFYFNLGINNLLEYASPDVATEFASLNLPNYLMMGIDVYEVLGLLEHATPDLANSFCRERIMIDGLENPVENEEFIKLVFRFASKDTIKEFYELYLTNDKWKNLDEYVVEYCLDYSDKEMIVEFANRILVEEENNWENYSFLFCLLLPYASKEISQNFSKKILLNERVEEIDQDIVLRCLQYSTDNVRNVFCKKYLLSEKWKLLSVWVGKHCIESTTSKIRNQFITGLLSGDEWRIVNASFVRKCIENATSTVRHQFTNDILLEGKWKSTDDTIIITSIKNSNQKTQKKFCLDILSGDDWKLCSGEIIETCFKYISDDIIVKDFCDKVIKENNPSHCSIRDVCLTKRTKLARNKLDEVLEELKQKYDDKK